MNIPAATQRPLPFYLSYAKPSAVSSFRQAHRTYLQPPGLHICSPHPLPFCLLYLFPSSTRPRPYPNCPTDCTHSLPVLSLPVARDRCQSLSHQQHKNYPLLLCNSLVASDPFKRRNSQAYLQPQASRFFHKRSSRDVLD